METQSAKISVYYECVRCGYETNIKTRMERHCVKTNMCKWKDIENKNKFKSDYEVFNECMKKKYKVESKKNETESPQIITIDSDAKSVSNIEYIPLLCDFFEAMDISHFSKEKLVEIIMFSSYEKIFAEILKNERNMNFYINLDSSGIMIYRNEINNIIKVSMRKGYSQICMNIYRCLESKIKMMKSSLEYDLEILKMIEIHILKINKMYLFNKECKNQFMDFLKDFCKEKKSMIFARFTQNYIMNLEQLSK